MLAPPIGWPMRRATPPPCNRSGLGGSRLRPAGRSREAFLPRPGPRLTHRAIEKLVELSKRDGVKLRQGYRRAPSAPPSWWDAPVQARTAGIPAHAAWSCHP
jgi:hypothetical protein